MFQKIRKLVPDENLLPTRQDKLLYFLNDILFRLSTEIPHPQARRTAQYNIIYDCGWHLLV